MGSPIVVPDSVCPRVAIETLGGPAFEPLDRNGLGAQILRWEEIVRGIFPFYRLTTASAPFGAIPQGS